MTSSPLTTAIEKRAFAAVRHPDLLAKFHVSFERLTAAPGTVERDVEAALDRKQRAAIVGLSGSGKSSVVAATLSPMPELGKPTYAPVRIGLGGISAMETLADAQKLALLGISDLASAYLDEADAEALRAKGAFVLTVTRRSEAIRTQLGGRLAGVSREIRQAVESYRFNRSADETIAALAAGLDVLSTRELAPLLLLDDADSLLGLAQILPTPDEHLVASFFARGIRPVLEAAPVAALIAVQPDYERFREFQEFRRDLVQRTIRIPPPSDFDQEGVRLLLFHAMREVGLASTPEQLFDDSALTTLTKLRYKLETVRELVSICEHALLTADSNGRDRVSEADVAYGVSQGRLVPR
jgi:hypothetical protein